MAVIGLGIESSCDETSCALVVDGREVLSNKIATQADFHATFGGVVPELASRMHVEAIIPTLKEAMAEAKLSFEQVSYIAVTEGPGLVGALLVGISAAKSIAAVTKAPLIGVNHIEGHIAANYLADPTLKPPFICLVVSGGHSHIIYVKDYVDFEILARTRDDAAGEAFDKIARALGLGYPGGPRLEAAAKDGDEGRFTFPKPTISQSLDFSFSGIKTAALNQLNQLKMINETLPLADFTASYQRIIADTLVDHAIKACQLTGCNRLCLAGGVSANKKLRQVLAEKSATHGITATYPPLVLCTDNAAMIAAAGYYHYLRGERDDLSLNATPSLTLTSLH